MKTIKLLLIILTATMLVGCECDTKNVGVISFFSFATIIVVAALIFLYKDEKRKEQ